MRSKARAMCSFLGKTALPGHFWIFADGLSLSADGRPCCTDSVADASLGSVWICVKATTLAQLVDLSRQTRLMQRRSRSCL